MRARQPSCPPRQPPALLPQRLGHLRRARRLRRTPYLRLIIAGCSPPSDLRRAPPVPKSKRSSRPNAAVLAFLCTAIRHRTRTRARPRAQRMVGCAPFSARLPSDSSEAGHRLTRAGAHVTEDSARSKNTGLTLSRWAHWGGTAARRQYPYAPAATNGRSEGKTFAPGGAGRG